MSAIAPFHLLLFVNQTIDKIKSLSALDQALTGDALQVAVEQYKVSLLHHSSVMAGTCSHHSFQMPPRPQTFCTSVLEPEPENLKKKESKKKKKKKKAKSK